MYNVTNCTQYLKHLVRVHASLSFHSCLQSITPDPPSLRCTSPLLIHSLPMLCLTLLFSLLLIHVSLVSCIIVAAIFIIIILLLIKHPLPFPCLHLDPCWIQRHTPDRMMRHKRWHLGKHQPTQGSLWFLGEEKEVDVAQLDAPGSVHPICITSRVFSPARKSSVPDSISLPVSISACPSAAAPASVTSLTAVAPVLSLDATATLASAILSVSPISQPFFAWVSLPVSPVNPPFSESVNPSVSPVKSLSLLSLVCPSAAALAFDPNSDHQVSHCHGCLAPRATAPRGVEIHPPLCPVPQLHLSLRGPDTSILPPVPIPRPHLWVPEPELQEEVEDNLPMPPELPQRVKDDPPLPPEPEA